MRRRRARDWCVGPTVGQWPPPDVLTGRASGRKTRADPPGVPPAVPLAPGIPAFPRDTWAQHLGATPGHSTWARHLGTAPGSSTWPQHLSATPIGLTYTYGLRSVECSSAEQRRVRGVRPPRDRCTGSAG